MARGPRTILLLLLFALTFFSGIQWERQDCVFDWPTSWDEIPTAIKCPDPPASDQPPATTTASER